MARKSVFSSPAPYTVKGTSLLQQPTSQSRLLLFSFEIIHSSSRRLSKSRWLGLRIHPNLTHAPAPAVVQASFHHTPELLRCLLPALPVSAPAYGESIFSCLLPTHSPAATGPSRPAWGTLDRPLQAAHTCCCFVFAQVCPWPPLASPTLCPNIPGQISTSSWRSLYSKSLYNVTYSFTIFIVRMPPLGHELFETKEFCLLLFHRCCPDI